MDPQASTARAKDKPKNTIKISSIEISPPKKRPLDPLSATEKQMIRNVYKYILKEESGKVLEGLKKTECVIKAAEMLGVSMTTIYGVLKDYKEHQDFTSPQKSGPKHTFKDKIDETTLEAIRQKRLELLCRNEHPTIKKLMQAVNDDPVLPNYSASTMRSIMKHFNFKWPTRLKRGALIKEQDTIPTVSLEETTNDMDNFEERVDTFIIKTKPGLNLR